MKAIGIDIGTTSICGILIDCGSGEVIKSITKNSHAFIKSEHEWEKLQNTELILSTALGICDALISGDTAVIGLTGQMHGIVYYDNGGKAISPLYTWQDARGSLEYNGGESYSDYLKIPSGYGYVTDFYNKHNHIAPDAAAGYCTIHDYFAMYITGNRRPVIHLSDAASFGDFDIESNSFRHEFSGRITADYEIIGSYKGIPVSAAIGDNQASVFGTLNSSGGILLNIGTGSQITAISSDFIHDADIENRPYTGREHLLVGAALCGGKAYSMLEKFYSDIVFLTTGSRIDMYEVMDKMPCGDTLPESRLIADTRFCGTRSSPLLTGSITNITEANFTPEQLRHAVIKGIIAELFDLFGKMRVTPDYIVGSGNGLRMNREMIRAAEQIFNMKILIPVHNEEAAYGAALFAMVGSKMFGCENDVKKIINYID